MSCNYGRWPSTAAAAAAAVAAVAAAAACKSNDLSGI